MRTEPDWDTKDEDWPDDLPEEAPVAEPVCCCDPWAASEECPLHGDGEHRVPRRCGLCGLLPADGEQHRQVYGGGLDGDDVEEVCVGEDRHQLAYAPIPDPWLDPDAAALADPPLF